MRKNAELFSGILIIIFCFIQANLFADEIHLMDGQVVKGKLDSVSLEYITYKDNILSSHKNLIKRSLVRKIVYDDGVTVYLTYEGPYPVYKKEPESGKLGRSFNPENDVTEKTFLFPIPLRLSMTNMQSEISVNLYDFNDKAVASGNAYFNQYMIKLSAEPPTEGETMFDYFISPEFGYFYRTIRVNDFSYNVDELNVLKEGFIPGIVSDPATGAKISKDTVSSLAYNAKFHSYFMEVKGGFHLTWNPDHYIWRNVNIILNPYASVSLAEYRKSIFEFDVYKDTEIFSDSYKFSFFSSYGFGFELGAYFSSIRVGFVIGYDKRVLKRFELPSEIRFKGVYYDQNLQLMRTQENRAKYTEIETNLLVLNAYYIF